MLIAGNVSITSATLTSIACDLKKNINGDGFDTPYDPAGFRRCVWLVQQVSRIRDTSEKRQNEFRNSKMPSVNRTPSLRC